MLFGIIFLLLAGSCRRIQPESAALQSPPPLPKATSQVNLSLEIPLPYLEQQLNQGLSQRLYMEEALEIGNGLFADIDINKNGHLTLLAGEEGKLRLSLPIVLDGKLKLEKKIFGQLVSTAVPFRESLVPIISFRPVLREDWNMEIEALEIESWGKPLQYDLLGYEIDFEPLVKKRVKTMMEGQLQKEALSRIDLRGLAQATWNAYGKPLHIKNGETEMYLYTIPENIKINNIVITDQKLLFAIGLEGEVQSQFGEGPKTAASVLPKLTQEEVNGNFGNFIDITLPLAIQYATIDEYLNKEMAGKTFRIDSRTQLVPHGFTTGHYGERALVKMDFTALRSGKKDLSGQMFLVGKPVFDSDRDAIVFENIDFEFNTKNFLANSANWLKQGRILNAIQKNAVFPIGDYMEEAKQELNTLGEWQTAFAAVGLDNTDLNVQGIYTTTGDIRLYLKSTGDIRIRWKQ